MQSHTTDNEPTVHFQSNEFVREVVNKLSTTQPDWKAIGEYYLVERARLRTSFLQHQIYGIVLEIYVFLVLQSIVKRRFDVYFHPITHGQETEHYEFYQHERDLNFNIRARVLGGKEDVAQYDLVVEQRQTGGLVLPVLFEMKMHHYPVLSDINKDLALKLNRSIMPDKINRTCAPLQERFKTQEVAFIIAVAKGTPLDITAEQRKFVEMGGIFAPISFTYQEFTTHLGRLRVW